MKQRLKRFLTWLTSTLYVIGLIFLCIVFTGIIITVILGIPFTLYALFYLNILQ